MKARQLIAVALVALAPLVAGGISGCSRTERRPPITVRVIDADSRRPVPNVHVDYAVVVLVKRMFLGIIPAFDPTLGYRVACRARGITGADGTVVLDAGAVRLRSGEEIAHEWYGVNTAIRDGPQATLALGLLQDYCTRGSALCAEDPDDIDVMAILGPGLREETITTKDAAYRAVVLHVFDSRCEPESAPKSNEQISDLCVSSRRSGPEVIEVPLRRAD